MQTFKALGAKYVLLKDYCSIYCVTGKFILPLCFFDLASAFTSTYFSFVSFSYEATNSDL